MTWICGKAFEEAQHLVYRFAFKGFFAALDELDDFAVHEIDAGNDHAAGLTGTLASSSARLRSATEYLP